MFPYMYTLCNAQIRVNVTISSNIYQFFVMKRSKSFLLYLIHYCYLQSPYCAIAHQNLFLLSKYKFIPVELPFPPHDSAQPLVTITLSFCEICFYLRVHIRVKCLFVFVWLISLNIMISSSISNDGISSFLWLYYFDFFLLVWMYNFCLVFRYWPCGWSMIGHLLLTASVVLDQKWSYFSLAYLLLKPTQRSEVQLLSTHEPIIGMRTFL
jgi:hypothetical protein